MGAWVGRYIVGGKGNVITILLIMTFFFLDTFYTLNNINTWQAEGGGSYGGGEEGKVISGNI